MTLLLISGILGCLGLNLTIQSLPITEGLALPLPFSLLPDYLARPDSPKKVCAQETGGAAMPLRCTHAQWRCAQGAARAAIPPAPRGLRWNRKSLGPNTLVSQGPGPGAPHHAACWNDLGLWGADGLRRLPLHGLQSVADERPLQNPAELLRGADAHPFPATPSRQHGGHGSRATPGLRPGSGQWGRREC